MNKMTNEFNEFVLFSEEESRALDERCFEKDARGKPTTYITCLVRNKDVQLKPEEQVSGDGAYEHAGLLPVDTGPGRCRYDPASAQCKAE